MLKLILIIAGILVGLILLVVFIGLLLPKRHVASRTAKFNLSADKIWQIIIDHAGEPVWRSEIKAKTRLPDRNAHPVWQETRPRGDHLTLETIEMSAPRKNQPGRMVTRIADTDLPYGGTWSYDLSYIDDNRSSLTITENGEIYNPIFRFVAKFFIGHTGTMDGYLNALSAQLGQPAMLQD